MDNDTPQNDGSSEQRCRGQHQDTQLENSKEQQEGDMRDGWRKTAEAMQGETDPTKLLDLADQLVADFDSSESPGSSTNTSTTASSNTRSTMPARQG